MNLPLNGTHFTEYLGWPSVSVSGWQSYKAGGSEVLKTLLFHPGLSSGAIIWMGDCWLVSDGSEIASRVKALKLWMSNERASNVGLAMLRVGYVLKFRVTCPCDTRYAVRPIRATAECAFLHLCVFFADVKSLARPSTVPMTGRTGSGGVTGKPLLNMHEMCASAPARGGL